VRAARWDAATDKDEGRKLKAERESKPIKGDRWVKGIL
jgi:hypothetical protein